MLDGWIRWCRWIDCAGWPDEGELGFVLLKAVGGSTRALVGEADELNATWFI
jgi:hypothetical protein